MKIKSINLLNYRNYSSFSTDFNPELNIFVGDNAQGKTNLLEAIYFMSTLRSFRTQNDRDLIKFDEEFFRIQCEIETDVSTNKAQVVVLKNGKSIKINETMIRRSSDYIGTLNCVIFSPQDINFFSDTPRTRRKFLDIEATKVSNKYLVALNHYFDVLKQRNALLKQPQIDEDVLSILTHQLIEDMWIIVDYRLKMVKSLNKKIKLLFKKLSQEDNSIDFQYQTEFTTDSEQEFKRLMHDRMKQNKMRDIYFKITHSGCHRDDLSAYMNTHELNQIASQGQKRLVLIALKLALVEFIYDKEQRNPILLLDDVFSELDQTHQQRFLENVPSDSQILLTTTSIDQLKELKRPMSVFEINKGQLITRRDLNG